MSNGTVSIEQLTRKRDSLNDRRSFVYAAADALSREGRELGVEIEALNKQIAAAEPIEDTVAWIPSTSRVGSHLTVVIGGDGFCTCEDARYRNPEGGCKHFTEAVERGFHDSRAVFKGGFDGPVTTEPAAAALITRLDEANANTDALTELLSALSK
jgi:hypothetical protein